MDGRKYQRKSGIKRTLVMLLALVMLASVCFPAMRVNAEQEADLTITKGDTELHTISGPEGLTENVEMSVEVSPENGGLNVTFADGVFSVNAENAEADTYTVSYAYQDAEGADQSASFTVTVAEAENDNTPQQPQQQPEQPQQQSEQPQQQPEQQPQQQPQQQPEQQPQQQPQQQSEQPEQQPQQQSEQPQQQPQQQPEQSKDVVPVEGERSEKAKEFDGKIATLTEQVNSFKKGSKTVTVTVGADTQTGKYTIEYGPLNLYLYRFTVKVKEKASGGSTGTDAFFFVRKDGNIQVEPSDYGNEYYTAVPAGSAGSWTEIKNALKEAKAIRNDLEAVERNILIEPTEKQLKAALGDKFDENNDYVVWYVVKWADGEHNGNHLDGAWHVDGVVRHNPFLHYNANGGDTGTVPDSEQHRADTDVTVVFENTRLGTVPTWDGYTFLGWANDPNATTPDYTAGGNETLKMPNEDKTLYAVWEKDAPAGYELQPDQAFIRVKKEFIGITADQIPPEFRVYVGETECSMGGALSQTWKIDGLETGKYTVKEVNAEIAGYDLSVDVDGVSHTLEEMSNGIQVEVKAASGQIDDIDDDQSQGGGTTYPVKPGTIFVGHDSTGGKGSVVIISHSPIDQTIRLALEARIKQLNGWKKDPTFTYYNLSQYKNGDHLVAGTIGFTYNGNSITFDSQDSYNKYATVVLKINEAENASITITNTYTKKATDVTIEKQVTGNMGDTNKEFDFTVTSDKPIGEDNAYQLSNDKMTATFTLKHGASIILKGVPIDANLTVTENGADAYEVKIDGVKVKDKGQEGSASKEITVTEGKTITVENRNEATIDTGIVTDSIPYVLLLTMAVIGAGVLLLNKRRVF